MYRVAAMYVVVGYAALEAADLLLPALDSPDWVFPILVGVAFLGFPMALGLAWYFDLTPEGVLGTDSRIVHGGSLAMGIRRGLVGIVALSAFGLGALALMRGLPEQAVLDPDRVMVFPLAVADGGALGASVGEDIATMIGHALDRAGSLRWIDAWPFLTPEAQTDPRAVTQATAGAVATAQGSRHFVTGRVISRGDSTTVLLDLFEVGNDVPVRRASAGGGAADPWRLGLVAANHLLTALIDAPPADFGDRFTRRDPAAVARFLTGESAYRRSRHSEALAAYRDALALDPQFAEAAIRGAQAASWEHRAGEASQMVEAALALDLIPRDRAFAEGMRAYVAGDSDRALAALQRAVELDPGMAAAYAQVGEVHHHLAPSRRLPDSVATAAFARAFAIDPTASGVLYHLAQHRLRAGVGGDPAGLARQFEAAAAEADLVTEIDISARCVGRGVGAVDWAEAAHLDPGPLLEAAVNLAAGDRGWACAEAAYRAVLAHDTVTTGWEVGRRWSSLKGLHILLLATGRADEAFDMLDSARASLASLRRALGGIGADDHAPVDVDAPPVQFAELLLLLDEAAGYDTGGRAEAVARANRSADGTYTFENNFRMWFLGVWEASRGNAVAARDIARRMDDRVATRPGTARDSLLARAMSGHAALAEGDSAAALAVFRGLRPSGDIQWNAAEALGLERLLHARLALAAHEMAEAAEVSTYLESTPSVYPLFLPAALEVRAAAMERTQRSSDARTIRQRIARLNGAPW